MRLIVPGVLVLLAMTVSMSAQTPASLAADWEASHISRKFPSDVRHDDLKRYLNQLTAAGVNVREVGRSYLGREIYQVEWGRGPLKVLMWSQMHGDEPTATSALIDMFAFLLKQSGTPWVKQLENAVTVRAVPMLNPDGAEMFVRRNQQGIDINRDALELRTPEARLLKQLRDDWNPSIGFNLHNQQPLTTVGYSPMQATISFLAVYGDPAKTVTEGCQRNQRLISAMVAALSGFIPGHIGRYGDDWTPTAFGDNFSAWGTPTILIETGALHGKDEMFLVKLNFIAFLTALNALASGSERTQDAALYLSLPQNSSGTLYSYIFRGVGFAPSATGVDEPSADIAINTERRRASFVALNFVRAIGDLQRLRGLEEYDASGYIAVQRLGSMRPGALAEFAFYKRGRSVDWTAAELEKQFPPDAIFSTGKWIRGEMPLIKH